MDEAELLSEAIAGVMKHVPIPTKEFGIATDISTLAVAVYATIGPRMEIDRRLREREAQRLSRPPGATEPPIGSHPPPPPPEGTAASVLADMPTEPLGGVTHEREPGITVAESDPELINRVAGNGADPASVVAATGASDTAPLLDLLAPPPIVE